MPFTSAALQVMADAGAADMDTVSLHSADPSGTGASEISGGTYARQATTWAAGSGGSKAGSQVTFDIPAGTTITHFGVWTSGGTFRYGAALTTSETFNGAGTYEFTPTFQVTSAN